MKPYWMNGVWCGFSMILAAALAHLVGVTEPIHSAFTAGFIWLAIHQRS